MLTEKLQSTYPTCFMQCSIMQYFTDLETQTDGKHMTQYTCTQRRMKGTQLDERQVRIG